jgi:cytochrome c oxidase assembly factor CtaG
VSPEALVGPVALLLAALYFIGEQGDRRRRRARGLRPTAAQRARPVAFYCGLLTIVVALESPLHALSEELFAAHMLQHLLLMTVAAPLLVLSAPWMQVWRGLPLTWRRRLARAFVSSPWLLRARRLGRALFAPAGAWLLFNGGLLVWHVPALYDLTLRSEAVHGLEHAVFLGSAIPFWAHLIDSPPLRARLGDWSRVAYATTSAVVGWALAVVLAIAPTPIYHSYAALGHRRWGVSAIADQQLAAGVMLGLGSIALSAVVFGTIYRIAGPGYASGGSRLQRRTATAAAPAATANAITSPATPTEAEMRSPAAPTK